MLLAVAWYCLGLSYLVGPIKCVWCGQWWPYGQQKPERRVFDGRNMFYCKRCGRQSAGFLV